MNSICKTLNPECESCIEFQKYHPPIFQQIDLRFPKPLKFSTLRKTPIHFHGFISRWICLLQKKRTKFANMPWKKRTHSQPEIYTFIFSANRQEVSLSRTTCDFPAEKPTFSVLAVFMFSAYLLNGKIAFEMEKPDSVFRAGVLCCACT